MFVCSVKTSRRGIAAALCCLLLALTLIVSSAMLPTDAVTVSAIRAATTEDQLVFLRSLGYTAQETPCAIEEVQIPDTGDPAFEAYNALQLQAELDLSEYSGKRVKCFSFAVTDEEGQSGTAHLYVYRDKIIGGDILPTEENATMRPLLKRDTQKD